MSIGGWFMSVHARVSKIVLGKRLCDRTAQMKAESEERLRLLRRELDKVNETTQEIAKDCGLVTNGPHRR